MARWKAVIFDLDGVLCRTDHLHYKAWKQLAERLGVPFDERRNDALRGVSRSESLELLLGAQSGRYTASEKAALAAEKNECYRALLQTLTPADVPRGVRETLAALRAAGVRLAVGSSSCNTGLILARLGIAGCFDAVADGTMIARSKPDPEVFLLAAKLLNTPPQQALVVEDAPAGIAAAKAGGFAAAGIGPAAACPQADEALGSLCELLPLCGVPAAPL